MVRTRSSSASEAERHRRWVGAVAAAYEADAGLLAQWSDTSQAAVVRAMLPGPPPPWPQTELVLRATGRMSLTGEESDAVKAAVPVFS